VFGSCVTQLDAAVLNRTPGNCVKFQLSDNGCVYQS
jgi:hypothetical protein